MDATLRDQIRQYQEQLRGTPWESLDLHRHVEIALKEPQKATEMPTCVLVILAPLGDTFKVALEARVTTFRRYIQEGHRDFALGGQPKYVVDLLEND